MAFRLLGELPGLAKLEAGPNGLAIEWTGLRIGHDSFLGPRGLTPRWTMNDPVGAVRRAKDALLELREQILAHVERRALQGVEAGSYRAREGVRVETEPERARVQVDEEPVETALDAGARRRQDGAS